MWFEDNVCPLLNPILKRIEEIDGQLERHQAITDPLRAKRHVLVNLASKLQQMQQWAAELEKLVSPNELPANYPFPIMQGITKEEDILRILPEK
jgi:hypothetical protein